MQDNPGGGELNPAEGVRKQRSLNLHQRLADSTWWCSLSPSYEMGRNGGTTSPEGPTIPGRPPIVYKKGRFV